MDADPPEISTDSTVVAKGRFWPYDPKVAVLLTPVLLVVLLAAWGLLQGPLHLDQTSQGWILLGITVLSLVPILLLVLQGIAASGGTVAVGAVKVALTAAASAERTVIVPSNVTQTPGVPIGDSGSSQIINALEKARTSDVVVVDLEDGHAWWETRLLILCSGAVRLGRPRVVVFTGQLSDQSGRFVGWAQPVEIRDTLLRTDDSYALAYERAMGLASAVHLGEAAHQPNEPAPVPVAVPPSKQWMVRAAGDRLNPHLEEQLLADALGPLELNGGREMGVGRVKDLFGPILRTSSVDGTEPGSDWLRSALRHDDMYLAITESGRYVAMMTRAAILNATLLELTQ